jgi:hypothetical protein
MMQDVSLHDLIPIAKAAAHPSEASPHTKWLRMDGQEKVVYVIQDAWANTCSLLTVHSLGDTEVERFARPASAVARALGLTGRPRGAVPAVSRSDQAAANKVLYLFPRRSAR